MGLWDRLVGRGTAELIEWVEPSGQESLAVRHTGLRLNAESEVLVRQGQACVICWGEVADVLSPGRFQLTPSALPKLAAANLVRGSGSAFRADVSFVSVVPHTSVRWATVASVVARDANNLAIPAKASGEFGFVVTDPVAFVREVVAPGDGPGATRSEVAALVTSQFGEIFRTRGLDGADLLGPAGRLGLVAGEQLTPNLRALGITLLRFQVKNVTVAPEVRRPLTAFAGGLTDGYRADLPAGLFPEGPAAPAEPGLPALPAGLADILEPPLPRNSGPKSVRLPLASDAPEGFFVARQPVSGPKSERLPLGDATAALGSENGAATEHLFDLPPAPTAQLRLRPVDPPILQSVPDSAPVAESTPVPAPAPVAPTPVPDRAPVVESAPAPVPVAVSAAVAEPEPAPAPEPAPHMPERVPGPPPLPAILEFHVAINGAAIGPFDLILLAARVRDGSLGRKSLVWRPGMDGWLAAGAVAELAPLFAGPPPIPPF